MLNQIASWLEDLSQLKLFIALVIYATCVALLFQLIVLPYAIPEMHAGNGLLVNGDWVNFHKIAIRKYEEILMHGWQVWELRPRGQFPSGIASIFYVLIYPEPWSLIPVNAIVWAASGIVVIRIVGIFTNNHGYATLACVPFLFLPSAAMWYTQLLKDGFYTLGLLLLLYSCTKIVRSTWKVIPLKGVIYNSVIALLSIILIWAVRPYSIYFALVLILFIVILVVVILARLAIIRKKISFNNYASLVSVFLIFLVANNISVLGESNKRITLYNEVVNKSAIYKKADAGKYIHSNWEKSRWAPGYVERKLLILSVIRAKYININPKAESNIRGDEYLFSVDEVIRFIPRAIQIAYTEPSPSDWVYRISEGSANFFYKVSMFEMLIVYVGLFFFIVALWLWRAKWEIWLIMAFTGVFLSVHGVVIPNIGTLYRMRYGMLMLIVSIGLAALVKIINDKNHPSDRL